MTTTATSTDLTTLDAGGPSGAVWSLPHGGDLDANGVVLHPGDTVGAHANAEVDVIIVGISGTGEVTIDDSASSLTSGTLVFVPKGATRSIAATGDAPLRYLTVHRARSGPTIRSGKTVSSYRSTM